ncbi:MAG: hypothetical protein HN929_01680 [Chloroflexi bacterium]|jgi:hypothetical protein|nr:hypothetical protein [Chloroflexota bacterium]
MDAELERLRENRIRERTEAFAKMAAYLRSEPLVNPNPHLDRLLADLDRLSEDRDGTSI